MPLVLTKYVYMLYYVNVTFFDRTFSVKKSFLCHFFKLKISFLYISTISGYDVLTLSSFL